MRMRIHRPYVLLPHWLSVVGYILISMRAAPFFTVPLLERYSERAVTMVLGIIVFAVIILSSYVENFALFTILYGVVGGTVLGGYCWPSTVAISMYFTRKRGIQPELCTAVVEWAL